MWGRLRAWSIGMMGLWGCTAPTSSPVSTSELTLLHTSDLHSRLFPFQTRVSSFYAELGLGRAGTLQVVGGAARLASLLAEERRRGAEVWLDSGDALEGAEIFQRFGGRPELALLSSLGLSAMALGNHELSLSGTALGALLSEAARFPVLSANLEPAAESPLYGHVCPSVVLAAGAVRLGVIGASNGEAPPDLGAANNPWGLSLLPAASALQRAIDQLGENVDLIVVLSHAGLDEDRALISRTTGIDLVLGGHQHLVTPEPEWQDDCQATEISRERGCAPRRVPIIHSGAYGQVLSRIELALAPSAWASQRLTISRLKLTTLPVSADVPETPEVAEYLEQVRPPPRPPLAWLPDGLARRSALGGDSPLGNLTTDAVRRLVGTDVVLLNSSGLRADLEPGVLLHSDLELAFPFDEPWRLGFISGQELRRGIARVVHRSAAEDCQSALQVSGLRLKVHCAACRDAESSCFEVTRSTALGEAPLDDAALLLVAVPEYWTRPGAVFEVLGRSGGLLPAPALPALVKQLATLPRSSAGAACVRALGGWPLSRCREAFGRAQCPLGAEQASAACLAVPELSGGSDDRIQMLP